jgi:hypothetical protein
MPADPHVALGRAHLCEGVHPRLNSPASGDAGAYASMITTVPGYVTR